MQTPRDIQFAHFATLLLDELLSHRDGMIETSDWWQEQARATIARRAYDLVQHTLERVEPSTLAYQPLSDVIARVPDMHAWPDEAEANIEAWLTTRPDPKDVERAITPYRRRTAQIYGD